jgi:UDP-N-acetyl-D-galactosamine dehydrogenase
MQTPLDGVRIAVVGLGYVGLPVALAAASRYPTVGYDLDAERVSNLRKGYDATGDVPDAEVREAVGEYKLALTSTVNLVAFADANFYIVAVPTPVDAQKRPDLEPLRKASEEIGRVLRSGDTVVYESTVYPGATEEVCVPILAASSGLEVGDFSVGYSPERISPGDPDRTFRSIRKIVSATTPAALARVAAVYESLVEPGVHRAPSVRVAEAAKVVENIQRDVNIGLINELAVIFDRMGVETSDVLDAAATKWNWLNFHPGLVGGHCIGVDPYYLAAKAVELGVSPEVIMSGRRVNEAMGCFVAQRVIREMALAGVRLAGAEVLILGVAFKAGVGDVRNSKVFDVAEELAAHGCCPRLYDPLVDPDQVAARGWSLVAGPSDLGYEAVVLAVPQTGLPELAREMVARDRVRVLADLHGAVSRQGLRDDLRYWRL